MQCFLKRPIQIDDIVVYPTYQGISELRLQTAKVVKIEDSRLYVKLNKSGVSTVIFVDRSIVAVVTTQIYQNLQDYPENYL